MKMHIKPSNNIGDLNAAFREEFLYLKLAFFSKPHHAYKGSAAKFLLTDPTLSVKDMVSQTHEGDIFIEDDMPTWQVERLFESEFGLHVQIFRKSGSIWLETSVSDDLTLERQNAKGRSSEKFKMPIAEPMDYREQD